MDWVGRRMQASMRETWQRSEPPLVPSPEIAEALVRQALPGARVVGMAVLSGGLGNSNIQVDLAGAARATAVLRLWQRKPVEAAKEIALLRRLHEIVPVPAVLAAGPADGRVPAPWAVLEFVEGERLDQAFAGGGDAERLGRSVGATLARLRAVRFSRSGFLDAALAVATPIPLGGAGLAGYVAHWVAGIGPGRLGPALCAALAEAVARDGHRLDADWAMEATLTHADYDPANLLVRDGAVAAVLDWEFAFAGGPAFDLGHLLRPPAAPDFIAGIEQGFRPAPGWQRVARLADLFSWLDFLTRPQAGESLIADSQTMIRAILEP